MADPVTTEQVEALREYVGAKTVTPRLTQAAQRAADALADVLDRAFREVPTSTLEGFHLEVGAEFWRRRNTSTGDGQYATADGPTPVRGPRDPLTTIWPELGRYVAPF